VVRLYLTAFLIAIPLAVLVPNVKTRHIRREVCTACITHRVTTTSGLWFGGHHLLDLGASEEIKESQVLREVFAGRHDHRWGINGASGFLLGFRTLIACGQAPWNPVAHRLEVDEDFRAATLKAVADGALTNGELVAVLSLPREPNSSDVESASRRALFKRGQEMLRTSSHGENSRWALALGDRFASSCPGPR
jgi:hypothetical protein